MGRKLTDDEMKSLIETINSQDDPREGLRLTEEKIEALKADGEPVPQELIDLQSTTHLDCMCQSQGR
ncbi:MAG: hypothetical protein AAFO62_11480 [Pseudomonadota bacterium]